MSLVSAGFCSKRSKPVLDLLPDRGGEILLNRLKAYVDLLQRLGCRDGDPLSKYGPECACFLPILPDASRVTHTLTKRVPMLTPLLNVIVLFPFDAQVFSCDLIHANCPNSVPSKHRRLCSRRDYQNYLGSMVSDVLKIIPKLIEPSAMTRGL